MSVLATMLTGGANKLLGGSSKAPPPSGGSSVDVMKAANHTVTPAQASGLGTAPGADDLVARVANLEATLTKKQNKITTLKGQLATAQTEASSKKIQAIGAEAALTSAQAAAQDNTLWLAAGGVMLFLLYKKGWFK